jgi:hypothetical protein
MALVLDILVIPTYNTLTLAVADASTYPPAPPVTGPTIEITIPAFGTVSLPFTPEEVNFFNSTSLGLTQVGDPQLPLPDGIYTLTYSVDPSNVNNVTKNIMRVDQLQEKFDSAFMKLDMMECDKAIKTQQKVDLNSIYFFIQGAIAAANNCAVDEANKLYAHAYTMLNNFLKNNCYCSGNNYVLNFN